MFMQNEMMDHMVAYHREQIEASMRASESDRAVILKYRARLGTLLISLGQRLRGDCMRDLMPGSPSAGVMSATLRVPAKGSHA